jgi:ABC-type amino acid transport substrate-binding protein
MNWRDRLAGLVGGGRLPPLPESFLFGVATADHQCEAYDPEHVDIRDVWERVRSPKAARGKATDFWNRYEEDIELAQKLGCTAFRFSIAWSRVEPKPGKFNQAAFDHYQDLIEKIISCHMQPILTLHHFTWPVHVEQRGGMISDDFPSIFAGYVAEVARRFGKDVPYWVTFNEPNLLIGGYFKPWWDANYAAPPGLPPETTAIEQVEAVGKLVRNLFLSHKAAYEIIKMANPSAEVGVNQYFYGLPEWLQQLVNRNVSGIRGYEDLLRQRDRLALRPSIVRGNFLADLFLQGKVDVVMAALTQTPEREQQVMFSEVYFVANQQLLVREGSSAAKAKDPRQDDRGCQRLRLRERPRRLMPGAVPRSSTIMSLHCMPFFRKRQMHCWAMMRFVRPGDTASWPVQADGDRLTDNERYTQRCCTGRRRSAHPGRLSRSGVQEVARRGKMEGGIRKALRPGSFGACQGHSGADHSRVKHKGKRETEGGVSWSNVKGT